MSKRLISHGANIPLAEKRKLRERYESLAAFLGATCTEVLRHGTQDMRDRNALERDITIRHDYIWPPQPGATLSTTSAHRPAKGVEHRKAPYDSGLAFVRISLDFSGMHPDTTLHVDTSFEERLHANADGKGILRRIDRMR